jgi:hypothetical protein
MTLTMKNMLYSDLLKPYADELALKVLWERSPYVPDPLDRTHLLLLGFLKP